ncbi:MAG: AsmA family protein, partial [Muribaculaceae bacterium]|nr:AsmA family protein [Muribaculaceae bacterium]
MASSTIYKVAKITAISLGALILLAVAAIIGATFYLTPSRVAAIVNKEASSYLKADVKVSEVNWTLWSSFPWLQVDIDSISIRSRSLQNIP